MRIIRNATWNSRRSLIPLFPHGIPRIILDFVGAISHRVFLFHRSAREMAKGRVVVGNSFLERSPYRAQELNSIQVCKIISPILMKSLIKYLYYLMVIQHIVGRSFFLFYAKSTINFMRENTSSPAIDQNCVKICNYSQKVR